MFKIVLTGKFSHPIFAIRSKKKSIVLRKKLDQKMFLEVFKKHLADKKKALTFALPNQNWVVKKRPKDL